VAATERPRHLAVGIAAVVALAVGCTASPSVSDRQATVASRGAQVMPFDLDATTHTFTPTADGGIQQVTADDPADATQVNLIREHLRAERENFATGDFDDPATIHGMDMPGVAELRAGYRNITVTYRERPDGAELVYTTTAPLLIDAIHAWFERQVMDHGPHATAA